MDQMIKYIFGNLEACEEHINKLYAVARRNRRSINVGRIISLVSIIYIVNSEKRYNEKIKKLEKTIDGQAKSIEILNNEIESLNIMEGESKM